MRWTAPFRYPNIRNTIDHYHLYERTLMMLRTKMAGAGSPCTYWRNTAITFYGTAPTDEVKCYCWNKSEDNDTTSGPGQPRRDHSLCMGTGYLKGYQKYGYEELIISTPNESTLTFSSDELKVSTDSAGEADRFMLSSSSSLSEFIETENFTLTNFKSVDRFIMKESIKGKSNRLEYFYSLDNGSTWIQLTVSDYTENRLANKQATGFDISSGATQIKFKIVFKKKTVASSSPILNSIRFRYRNHMNLVEIDPRFGIEIPAFLASREQPKEELIQSELGLKMTKPIQWWVLPEANIEEMDIIMFIQGELENEKYEVQNLTKHTHGPELKVLHRTFDSAYIRDRHDVVKIVDLLN